MSAPHDESRPHIIKRLVARAALAVRDTPASTPSLEFQLSGPTPPASLKDALAGAWMTLNMRSPSVRSSFTTLSFGSPPEEIHSKTQDEQPPRRSKTDTMSAIVGIFRAPKTLQQVLGHRDPEPFVSPPAIPVGLTARFEAGLHVYRQQRLIAPGQTEAFQQRKTNLADIVEEKESPVRAASVKPSSNGTHGRLKIAAQEWTSHKQAVTFTEQYTFLDSDSDADVTKNSADEGIDSECDEKDCRSWKYRSSTTPANSDCSRPGSIVSNEESLVATLSRSSTSPFLPPESYHGDDDAGAGTQYPTKKSLPPALQSPSAKLNTSADQHKTSSKSRQNALREIESDFDEKVLSSPTPRITIQAPLPVEATTSRKRGPTLYIPKEYGPSLSQHIRHISSVGLPVLPSNKEAVWKAEFLGNTHALLTILLTWSHAMWTFYNQLPNPKLFSVHPAFPCPVSPPKRKQLVSVSFYDTSVDPHMEIRFLGPGDAGEMSYNEVDVFNDPGNTDRNSHPSPRCRSPANTVNESLGLLSTDTRYTRLAHRASTGEGKWCYVLIKAHSPKDRDEDGGPHPHILLAWHSTAVTAVSDCLHTVFPDNSPSLTSAPAYQRTSNLKRFSSLQNLGYTLRSPSRSGFQQSLRPASSSSHLPGADAEEMKAGLTQQEGGAMLHRCVVKMGRAGGVPLVEGWRVDVRAFKGWMEACGRGQGKVIMWREREELQGG
ncbi:hypothetical protein SVAN01_05028 [Stagonosporopsis vannaccii]|nr:hypothetical protein SVAN01_05028 [Stagonosporopsis vannaccii]